MELTGELLFSDGCYWIINEVERWTCPFGAGDRAEVLIGGKWLAVTMQSDGYLHTASGRRLLPMQLMRVRVVGY